MLSNILAGVNESLETLFAAAHPDAVPALQVLVGSEFLQGQDAANRVIWVPVEDRYTGPAKQTAAQTINPSVTPGGIPRNLRNRFMGLECHIWGQPPATPDPTGAAYFDSVDDLIRWVVIAVHMNLHGNYELLGGGYPPSQAGSGFTTYGRSYVLRMEFETPIEDQDVTTVTLQGLPATCSIEPFIPAT